MLRASPTKRSMISDQNERQALIRGLGLIAAVSIIIGNVIGTGVFLKARVMTCNVGTPGWVVMAWVAAGLLSLAGALTYAELTAMKPQAGGEYVFLRDAYGRVSSFLFGWMQMFIAKPGSQAAAAMAFAIGMNDFLGKKLGYPLTSFTIAGTEFEISTLQIVAIMVVVIFTTLNCASVAFSGQIATALTGVKIAHPDGGSQLSPGLQVILDIFRSRRQAELVKAWPIRSGSARLRIHSLADLPRQCSERFGAMTAGTI